MFLWVFDPWSHKPPAWRRIKCVRSVAVEMAFSVCACCDSGLGVRQAIREEHGLHLDGRAWSSGMRKHREGEHCLSLRSNNPSFSLGLKQRRKTKRARWIRLTAAIDSVGVLFQFEKKTVHSIYGRIFGYVRILAGNQKTVPNSPCGCLAVTVPLSTDNYASWRRIRKRKSAQRH